MPLPKKNTSSLRTKLNKFRVSLPFATLLTFGKQEPVTYVSVLGPYASDLPTAITPDTPARATILLIFGKYEPVTYASVLRPNTVDLHTVITPDTHLSEPRFLNQHKPHYYKFLD